MLESSRRGPARRLLAVLGLLALAVAVVPSAAGAYRHRAHRNTIVPAALKAAAAKTARADRHLVAKARVLHSCLRTAGTKSGVCGGARSAVQQAGLAFTSAERGLAARARHAGRSYGRAPQLKASGYKLSWTAPSRVNSFVVVADVPGQGYRYSIVHGTSVTPPPVPGVTVTYLVRTASRSSHWSNTVKVDYPSVPSAPTPTPPAGKTGEELNLKAAPQLGVSGQTLTWNLVPGVSTYVLMTKVPGQAEAFTSVSGNSTTPPAVPGKSVAYSIRTAVDGSAWAPNVTIAYPETPAETAPKAPEKPPVTTPSNEGFQPGVNGGTNSSEYKGAVILGAKIVRIDIGIGTPASAFESTVANYAAKGIRVAPLAGFYGRLPSPAEAQSLASWAKAYGPGGTFWAKRSDGYLAVRDIEFGNETSGGYQYGDNPGAASYAERARVYALRLKEAAEAISASGSKVGLLAVSEDWTGDWMNGMFAAVPNLGSYIAGWVSHPYGTGWRSKIETIVKQAAAHGAPSTLPIDVTEWGLSTDNGKCVYDNFGLNPCMNYTEAAEQLKRNVGEIKTLLGSRVGLFLIYKVTDLAPAGLNNDRENYFGLLQNEDQPKGPLTAAAQELLAL
jgi:hypothetical protein